MNAITTRFAAALLLCLAGLAGATGTAAPAAVLKGEVLEVREVDSYTYLRLKTADGEVWAAITKAPVKKGAVVGIANPAVMRDFESRTLNRRFDTIVFGTLADANAPAPTAAAAVPQGAKDTAPPAAMPAPVKVGKATGTDARTVAEVVVGRDKLKDKSVSVRAQVVKVNRGIMGKNWFHVQDGSGSASAGTNDLVVTSKDIAAVGDVLDIKGMVRTEVQLGAGYHYSVLIDDAALRK
jgi:hypothetical protein